MVSLQPTNVIPAMLQALDPAVVLGMLWILNTVVSLLGMGGAEGGAEGEENYYCGNIHCYFSCNGVLPHITDL